MPQHPQKTAFMNTFAERFIRQLFDCIDDPGRLEGLGEALLDSVDGAVWLNALK